MYYLGGDCNDQILEQPVNLTDLNTKYTMTPKQVIYISPNVKYMLTYGYMDNMILTYDYL